MKPRALDLFCGAGGATKGLQMAGFHVTGVDIKRQPRYCGDEFHQADALTFSLEYLVDKHHGTVHTGVEGYFSPDHYEWRKFDFIWASPPCEFGSQLTPKAYRGNHENLIEPTRERLVKAGVPFCIENVPSNAGLLVNPFMLCGSQFGLKVRRHRFFEVNFPLSELFPPCDHSGRPVLISGTHRRTDEPRYEYTAQQCRGAAGLDWMRRIDMDKAIPPVHRSSGDGLSRDPGMVDSSLSHLPKRKRGRVPRQKYQRPEVYATGKREKLWRGEWRSYFIDAEGKQQSRHKSKSWSRANFTKSQAQAELDKIIREQQEGGPKRDGSMTLSAFWDEVYFKIKARKWTVNTRYQVEYLWTSFIKPEFGSTKLRDITKASVELLLVKMADQGKGAAVLQATRTRLHSIFEEALDNDYVPKNPCRKIELPQCRANQPTRALQAEEVQRLWDGSQGFDYIVWRTLLLTGCRINELWALDRSDLLPEGLRIDESALQGKASTTKTKKERVAPLPASLRAELEEWLTTHNYALMFPRWDGTMRRIDEAEVKAVQKRGRAIVPDLTFRMCRTTFATLFEGDIADVQASLGHHAAEFTLRHYRKTITERHQAAVEQLDRRLKLVPREGVA